MMPFSLDSTYLDEVLDLTARSTAEFCETLWPDSDLDEDIEEYWPSRRDFCAFLDIGESTLSGWLKEKRVPRYAKVAFGLMLARDLLAKEVRRLRDDAKDLKILKAGDHYQLCRFRPDKDGIVVGEIVADNIATFRHAAILANAPTAFRLLQKTKDAVNNMLDLTHNASFIEQLEELRETIVERTMFASNLEEWKKLFGDARLDDLSLFDDGLDTPGVEPEKGEPS